MIFLTGFTFFVNYVVPCCNFIIWTKEDEFCFNNQSLKIKRTFYQFCLTITKVVLLLLLLWLAKKLFLVIFLEGLRRLIDAYTGK